MSRSLPMVSVVIITYNKAQTITATIESVLRQTYKDFEIIVVDDGSKDDTADFVQTFEDQVRFFPKENGGTGSARNLGIVKARGRYVAFLDGDDLWLPKKLELQIAAFEREPDIDAVQCSAYLVDNGLNVVESRKCRPSQDSLLNFLLFRNLPAFASTVMVRRERLNELGGFATDLVILSDWDMACRISNGGILRSIPDFLILYRQYQGNQSRDVGIHIDCGFRSMDRLFADAALDPRVRARESWVRARFYAMLAGGYIRNNEWSEGFSWVARALSTSPRVGGYVAGMPLRRLQRVFSLQHKRCFADQMAFAVLRESDA